MRRAAVALAACLALGGCLGPDEGQPSGEVGPPAAGASGPAITAGCEDLGPDPGWRHQAVDVGRFGLFVPNGHLWRSHGHHIFKMGAVVGGHAPVTLRVPNEARGSVGLIYGDASRGWRHRPSGPPVEVTFEPCPDRPRSGYVGGLLLETAREPVTLEVDLTDSRTERLTIEPAP